MAVALQRTVRRKLLAMLKADTDLTDLVAASAINPDGEAPWPFIVLRSPRTLRLRVPKTVNGGTVSWDVHAFARARVDEDDTVLETAEDHAGRIGGAIEMVFADQRATLEDGSPAHISLSDMLLMVDGDKDAYHYFAQVNVRVLAA